MKPYTLVSYQALLQGLVAHGLDGCTGLDDWAQRVLVRNNQSTNLIGTLKQSLLDMGKTTSCFQILVSFGVFYLSKYRVIWQCCPPGSPGSSS